MAQRFHFRRYDHRQHSHHHHQGGHAHAHAHSPPSPPPPVHLLIETSSSSTAASSLTRTQSCSDEFDDDSTSEHFLCNSNNSGPDVPHSANSSEDIEEEDERAVSGENENDESEVTFHNEELGTDFEFSRGNTYAHSDTMLMAATGIDTNDDSHEDDGVNGYDDIHNSDCYTPPRSTASPFSTPRYRHWHKARDSTESDEHMPGGAAPGAGPSIGSVIRRISPRSRRGQSSVLSALQHPSSSSTPPPPLCVSSRASSAPTLSSCHSRCSLSTLSTSFSTPIGSSSSLSSSISPRRRLQRSSLSSTALPFSSVAVFRRHIPRVYRILMWFSIAWLTLLAVGYRHYYLLLHEGGEPSSISLPTIRGSNSHSRSSRGLFLMQPRQLEAISNGAMEEQGEGQSRIQSPLIVPPIPSVASSVKAAQNYAQSEPTPPAPLLLSESVTGISSLVSQDLAAIEVEIPQPQLFMEDNGIIHIVHTRLMQSQPHLVDLGLARLQLMEAFLWASLKQQTSRNFVLVVRTDPDLDARIREPLQALLESAPLGQELSYILLASNDNPQSQLRHILELPVDANGDNYAIWSGDWNRVRAYLQRGTRDDHLILETRLDADDALHLGFVDKIQNEARSMLQHMQDKHRNQTIQEGCPDFYHVWCSARHAEWQYQAPWSSKFSLRADGAENEDTDDAGSLISLKFRGCITAGLTVGHVGGIAGSLHLPVLKHQHLPGKDVPLCNKKKNHKRKGNCITYLDLLPVALRARTPTSAGMWNVLWQSNNGTSPSATHVAKDKVYTAGAQKQRAYQNKLWILISARFGLSQDMARSVRQYLQRHLRAIATDNLHGQCTSGHSCKDSSQALLQAIIDGAESEETAAVAAQA